MKTRMMSFIIIAAIVLAALSSCGLGLHTQPEEVPAEALSVLEEAAPTETPTINRSEQPAWAAPAILNLRRNSNDSFH